MKRKRKFFFIGVREGRGRARRWNWDEERGEWAGGRGGRVLGDYANLLQNRITVIKILENRVIIGNATVLFFSRSTRHSSFA